MQGSGWWTSQIAKSEDNAKPLGIVERGILDFRMQEGSRFRLNFGKLALVVRTQDVARTECSRRELSGAFVRIGRADTNDVVLPSGYVSANHARLERRAEGWYIVDLTSTNGTWVGRTRVTDSAPVDEDSSINIGDFSLRLEPLATELFLVTNGRPQRVRFGSRSELTLGRHHTHDVVVADSWVSSTQVLLTLTDDGIVVTDLKSRHGSFLSGVRVQTPMQLRPGDVVTFGQPCVIENQAHLTFGARARTRPGTSDADSAHGPAPTGAGAPPIAAQVARPQHEFGEELAPYAHLVRVFVKKGAAAVALPDDYGDLPWSKLDKPLTECLSKIALARGYGRAELRRWSRESEYLRLREQLGNLVRVRLSQAPSSVAAVFAMDGREFEVYLGGVFSRAGFTIHGTAMSHDHGADLRVEREGRRGIVQAKRWTTQKVGGNDVVKTLAAKNNYDAEDAWLITTSGFTSGAQLFASKNGIVLIDRASLGELPHLLKQEAVGRLVP